MNGYFKGCAIVLVCFSCVILSSARIIVAETKQEFDSAQLFFANYDLFETFDGEMVPADAADLTGKVVFSADITTIPVMNIIRDLIRLNPRAIIVSERYSIPGRGMYNWDGQEVSSITLPVIQVSLDVSQRLNALLNTTQSLNVTISSEGNRWTDVYHSWGLILWRVVLILCGCSCIGVAIWKTIQFKLWSKNKRCQISVVSACLTIEIIGNLWRVLYVALDPFGCCNVLTYWGVNTLNSLSFPYNVSSFLLVTLYWHECMSRASLDQNPFLKKLKIPFYCLAGGLIVLDILFTILSFFENMRKSVVLVAIYSAILVALLVFYGITAARLLKRLSKTNKLLETQYRVKKMTITLLIGGLLQLFGLILTVIFLIDSIMQVPVSFVTVWGVFFLLFDGMSMARLLTFQKRAKHNSSGTATGSSQTTEVKM